MRKVLVFLAIIALASGAAACAATGEHYDNDFRHSGHDHDRSK